MFIVSIRFFIKRNHVNLFLRIIPLAMTLMFVATTTKVPIINYQKYDGSIFEFHNYFEIPSPIEKLNELDLYNYNAGTNETIYRIIDRNYYPTSVRIHLNHTEQAGILYFAFYGRADNEYEREPSRMERTYILDSKQYHKLTRLFFFRKFWHTPTYSQHLGQDGFSWIIEGVESNRYHIVSRWCPEYGNIARIGNTLYDFAHSLFRESEDEESNIIIVKARP